MDSICFTDSETGEELEVFVLEQTCIGGINYLLVTEEEEEDSLAYILKEEADEQDDLVCSVVEDDTLLEALSKVFSELLEDVDIEF